jgi:hypothetical protein
MTVRSRTPHTRVSKQTLQVAVDACMLECLVQSAESRVFLRPENRRSARVASKQQGAILNSKSP